MASSGSAARQHLIDRRVTPGFAPAAGQHPLARKRDAVLGERRPETVATMADRFGFRRTGNVREVPPTKPDEVLAGEPPAGAIVGEQTKAVGVVDPREGIDDGDILALEIERGPRHGASAGHDDAVDAFCQQGVHMLALALRIARRVAEEDRYLRRFERILDAVEHRNAEAALAVDRDQPDREATLARQAARHLVRPEAQALGDAAHRRPRFLAQLPVAVERLRDRAHAHARRLGDVANGQRRSDIVCAPNAFVPSPATKKKVRRFRSSYSVFPMSKPPDAVRPWAIL